VDVEYYQSSSPSELSGGAWQTDAPLWASGKYVWQRTKTTYTDGSTAYTTPACLTGEKGSDGLSYAPNLITGGKSFQFGGSNNNWLCNPFYIGSITAGDKIAVAAESVMALTGAATEFSVLLHSGKTISNILNLSAANGYSGVLTADGSYSSCYVYVYAGVAGATAYNKVQFTGLVAVKGETPAKPWRPSIEEMKGDSVTIADKSVKYAASASGTTVPADDEWQTGIPTLTDAKPFMWTRVVITYNGTNGSTTSYSVAYKGRNGANGKSVTITSKSVLYAISSSGTAAPSTGWQAGVPEATKDKPFVWTKTTVSYSDGTTTVAYSVGRIGSDGKGISTTKTMFGASSSPETQPASWSETEPELGEGEYLWTKEVTTYTDGTTSETVPVVSLDYLSRVIRKGKSALMGGLVLGNILAAADENGDVRAYLSGLASGFHALRLGVNGFNAGGDGETAVSELNVDGSFRLGRFVGLVSGGKSTDTVSFIDDDGSTERLRFTSKSLPTLSSMLSQTTEHKTATLSGMATTQQVKQGALIYLNAGLTTTNESVTLTVQFTLHATAVPAVGETVAETRANMWIYKDGAEWGMLGGSVHADISNGDMTITRTGVIPNAPRGKYQIAMRVSGIAYNDDTNLAVEASGTLKADFDPDNRATVMGKNGFQYYKSENRYFQADDSGDATVKTDSVQAKTIMADKLTIGGGWGFGVLWMGLVNENGEIAKSTGPLRAKGRGNVNKSGSEYTINFPGGNSTVGTNYAVFCQPEKTGSDGRYVTVYGKTSSSFKVAARWGDKQQDTSFYFMVVSMKDWY
jgi:hypothetical protein